jgi:hypothetical protein
MQVVYERCCGIDVHKTTLVVCVIVPGPDGKPVKVIHTFGTMTDDLKALVQWLRTRRHPHRDGKHRGLLETRL